MKQKSGTGKALAEHLIKNIRRATRKQYSSEEKIRIVLEALRGEELIAAQLLPRRLLKNLRVMANGLNRRR